MALAVERVAVLKIPNGANVSNVFKTHITTGDAVTIIVMGPASLPESVKWQVTDDPDAVFGATVWRDLKDINGTLIPVPAAAEARIYTNQLASAMGYRLTTIGGGNVAGDRSFVLTKQFVLHPHF